jgi:hypothetical protein
MISKQEAMVLITELDLVNCSETIEAISISKSKCLRKAENKGAKLKTSKLIDNYPKRDSSFEAESLEEFYIRTNNSGLKSTDKFRIPHFVGVNGKPVFPMSYGYAKQILIAHKPWRAFPTGENPIQEATDFLNSQACPESVRVPFMRAVNRHATKMKYYEPKASESNGEPATGEDVDTMMLFGLKGDEIIGHDQQIIDNIDRGKDFNWGIEPKVSVKK